MPIASERQQQSNWCWAACFRMACSSFGIAAAEQCAIAGKSLGVESCCPAGSNPDCDKTLPSESVPTLYASVALAASAIAVSDADFRSAVSGTSLALLLLAFPLTYHFVLLESYDTGRSTYVTHDPKYDAPFPASFADLSSAYGSGGSIAHAWRIGRS